MQLLKKYSFKNIEIDESKEMGLYLANEVSSLESRWLFFKNQETYLAYRLVDN